MVLQYIKHVHKTDYEKKQSYNSHFIIIAINLPEYLFLNIIKHW